MLKYLISLLAENKFNSFALIFLFIVYSFINIFIPIVNKNLFDDGIVNENLNKVILYTSFITFLFIINQFINFIIIKIRLLIANSVEKKLYSQAFFTIINSTQLVSKNNTVEIFNQLTNDIENIKCFYGENTTYIIMSFLTFIGGMIGLFVIDKLLSLLVLLFIPVKYFMTRILSLRKEKLYKILINKNATFSNIWGEILSSKKEINLFNLEELYYTKMCSKLKYKQYSEKNSLLFDTISFSADAIIIRLITSIIIISGSILLFNHKFSLGSLFAFIAYTSDVQFHQ